MRLHTICAAALLVFACGFSTANGQSYWDINTEAVDGSGGPAPSGNWDDVSANWNFDPTGNAAFGTTDTWAGHTGDSAFFSAGSDATDPYIITVGTVGGLPPNVAGITFQDGTVTLTGGTINLTDPTMNVGDGLSATISSNLSGTGGLTKSTGAGTLTLGADNSTLSGVININAGKLVIPAAPPAGVLGTAGINTSAGTLANDNTAVNDGATLEITGVYNPTDMLFLAGDGVGGSGGALRKVGSGNTVQKGGIRIRGTADHARIFSNEGTLWLVNTVSTNGQSMQREFGSAARNLVFDGPGNIATSATGTVVDSVSYFNYNIAIASSKVIKQGNGSLTLNAISSWYGGITINQGIVNFSADTTSAASQQLGQTTTDGSGAAASAEYKPAGVILDGGTLRATNTGSIFTNNNRGMQVGPNGGTVEASNALFLWQSTIRKVPSTATRVTLTKTGTGEFRYNANATQTRFGTDFDQLIVKAGLFRLGSVTGQDTELGFGLAPAIPTADAIVLDGGAIGASFGLTLDANRGITLGSGGGILNLTSGSMVIPSIVTGGGTLRVIGTQGLTLSGTNTYTGNTIIGSDITMSGGIATTTAGALTINSDASLGAVPGSPVANSVSLGTATAAGTLTASQDMTINSNRGITIGAANGTISVASTKTANYGGVLAGSGNFTKTGSGTLLLTNTGDAYTGSTTISAGTLRLGNTEVIPDGSAVTVNGTLDMNSFNETIGSLAGTGGVSMPGNLTTGGNGTSTSHSGVISGAGSFTKIGGGTQTLTGNNTYSGGTTVSAGTLLVNNDPNTTTSGTGSGPVGVASGATLGGTGRVGGAVTNDGTIAPGASVGSLKVSGNVTMDAASHLAIELNAAASDLLDITGNLSLLAGSILDVTGDPTGGSNWVIANYTGSLSGTFGLNVTSGYMVNYGTGTNSQIILNRAGDWNGDTKVNAADYVTWRKDPTGHGGDPDGYITWRENFDQAAAAGPGLGGPSLVPEPGTLLLTVVGILLACVGRRRR